ncbi:MAG: extracellular solute-binding protein [Bacteroidota bacterium]
MIRLTGAARILGISALLAATIALPPPVLGGERGYPIPGGITLSIWFPNPSAAVTKSLGDRLCFQVAEKRTGVKIKWMCPMSGLDNEQFNLMLASRDLPDLTGLPSGMGGWLAVPGGARKFYDDGIIIRLNDLIDKYAPNIKALLKKEPTVRKQLVDDQGNIFFIPQMRIQPEIRVFAGFMIRQDWLDKLKLKAPTTPDEWYNVLKAFKTKDPNGNGKADEIPFGASRMNTNGEFTRLFWMFGANIGPSYSNGLQQQKGKVVFSPITAEYKQALTWIRKLYAEGLIDPDFPILERAQFESKIYANQIGALYGNAGSGVQKHMTNMAGKEPKTFTLAGIPFPKAPGKRGYNFESSVIQLATGNGLAITTACKNPVAAIKWLDYAFSKEGHMLFNFGVLGQTYTMDKGYPRFTSLITNNPQKLTMTQAMSVYINENWLGLQDVRYFEQYQKLPIPGVAGTPAWDAIQTWTDSLDTSLTLPPISLSPAESQATVAKFNEINTYVQEMCHRFILGTVKLTEFDAYVAQIKRMGIDDVVKAYQAALDRYNAR